MAFVKKEWVDRVVEYPGRRILTPTGQANTYDVIRSEGTITTQGDPFNADTMNDLEQRVFDGIESVVVEDIDCSTVTFSTPAKTFKIEDGVETNSIKFSDGVVLEGIGESFIDTSRNLMSLTKSNVSYKNDVEDVIIWGYLLGNSIQIDGHSLIAGVPNGTAICPIFLKKGHTFSTTSASDTYKYTVWGVKKK